MPHTILKEAIAEHVWNAKCRWFEEGAPREPTVEEPWSRMAVTLARPELHHRDEWRVRFETTLSHFRFLPGGRILAGAGAQRRVTLFNWLVMGHIRDSMTA